MSVGETPRTWTLEGCQPGSVLAACVWADDGPALADGEKVKAYEAAPVDAERERMLDLLERVREAVGAEDPSAWVDLEPELGALLREHGQLTDSPSAPVSLERGE